jgi:DNA-binding transcriptional ArsR family regulator
VAAHQVDGLTALGDPTRRAVFELLGDGPRAVGEIASDLPVTRSAVSQHLKVLKEAGLVIDRPDGTRRRYELNPDGIGVLCVYFERFWTGALTSFKNRVEQQEEQ